MSGHGQPKRNPNLRLTLVKNKYAVGLLIFPQREFLLFPSPSTASTISEAVAHSSSDITSLALGSLNRRERANDGCCTRQPNSCMDKRFTSTVCTVCKAPSQGRVAGWV